MKTLLTILTIILLTGCTQSISETKIGAKTDIVTHIALKMDSCNLEPAFIGADDKTLYVFDEHCKPMYKVVAYDEEDARGGVISLCVGCAVFGCIIGIAIRG